MKQQRNKIIIITFLIVLLLLGVGLAVYFCIPREPTVNFGEPQYSNLSNTNSIFSITIQLPFTFDNPNYYEITMKSLDMDVYYRDIFIFHVLDKKDYNFKKRGITDTSIETEISITDITILAQIFLDIVNKTALNINFSGNAEFEILSIMINHKISFSKSIVIME